MIPQIRGTKQKKYEKLLTEKEEQLKQLLAKPTKQKPLINILQDLIPFVGFKESEVLFDKKTQQYFCSSSTAYACFL